MQVTQEHERVVLDALMRQQPVELAQTSSGRLEECSNADSWGPGLRTEWTTHCYQKRIQGSLQQSAPHRLYVQAAPGEMRIATVKFAEA